MHINNAGRKHVGDRMHVDTTAALEAIR